MSSGFISLGRNCPICNGARKKKDCRQNQDTKVVHCRARLDAPPGWHYKKEDAIGFGMYGLGDRPSSYSDEERIWKAQEARIREEKQEKELRAGALPVDQRDVAIRKIWRYQGLSPEHRGLLRQRGLTDPGIEKALFFTITRDSELPPGIPANLPGVRICIWSGKLKFAGQPGIACVAFDVHGRAIGWQVRLVGDIVGGKYRWAKGTKTSHLPNGELPVTVARPATVRKPVIGLCEGFLKAQRAAGIHEHPFIGASNLGLWKTITNSKGEIEKVLNEQTLEALSILSAELGTKDVVLYADAGAVSNSHVYPQYLADAEAVKKAGYNFRVAWWGQTTKGQHPDCDELNLLDGSVNIEYQSWAKFAATAKTFGGQDSNYDARIRDFWRDVRKFSVTADQVSDSRWVNPGHVQPGKNYIQGGTGSGKSTYIFNEIDRIRDEALESGEDTRFFIIGYRNTLLLQTAAKTGFYHIHDAAAAPMMNDPNGMFCACLDSLWRFKATDFIGAVVVLDEFCSVIHHGLKSGTLEKNRELILAHFVEMISLAKYVICLDAHLSDLFVNYLQKIDKSGKPIFKHQNVFKAPKPHILMLGGSYDFTEKVKKNDRSPILYRLDEKLAEGGKVAIATDSQVQGEAIEEIYAPLGYKILRIDSKTTPKEEIKRFFEDCDGNIAKEKPDILIYTPSAESGLDISIPDYFSIQCCFFFGVIGVNPMIQMIGRIRDPKVPRYVWCKEYVAVSEKTNSGATFPEVVTQHIKTQSQHQLAELNHCSTNPFNAPAKTIEKAKRYASAIIERDLSNPHFVMGATLLAIENAEKRNLRSYLIEALQTGGHRLTYYTDNESHFHVASEKDAKESVKRQNSHDIFVAPVADEEIEDLAHSSQSFNATWEEQCRRRKAVILSRLLGIQHTPIWSADAIYQMLYEDPNLISRLEFYHLFANPGEVDSKLFDWLFFTSRKKEIYLGGFRNWLVRIRALQRLGFDKFLQPGVSWTNTSPEVLEFVEACKTKEYSQILGYPGKYPIRFVGNCLVWMGYSFTSTKNSEGDRSYSLNESKLYDPLRIEALKAIKRRYAADAIERQKREWSDPPYSLNTTAHDPMIINNTGSSAVIPELHIDNTQNLAYSLNTTAHDPMIINNTGSSAVIPELHGNSTQNLAYSPDTTAPTPVNINKTAPGAVRNISCDNNLFLEGMPGGFKKGDLVLTPQGKGEVLFFLTSSQEYIVGVPGDTLYLSPCELSPFPLVKESPEASSPLPSEKISAGPSKRNPRVAVPSEKVLAACRASIAAVLAAAALASPAAASQKASEAPQPAAIAQESAHQITAQPTPAPVAPALNPAIKIDSRVRYLGKGSIRYGMVGTVTAIVDRKVKVRLDYHPSLTGDWRNLEDAFPYFELVE